MNSQNGSTLMYCLVYNFQVGKHSGFVCRTRLKSNSTIVKLGILEHSFHNREIILWWPLLEESCANLHYAFVFVGTFWDMTFV